MEGKMLSFITNDNVKLKYLDTGATDPKGQGKEPLILIHGFTGSSRVWKRNIPGLSEVYRVIAPDLRGHGESEKAKHGFHVSRLAMDLRELLAHLIPRNEADVARGLDGKDGVRFKAIGGSLGCSILWCYAELFTTSPFTHMIFVDQSPLQNSTLDGWDSRFCNRGMNSAASLAALQATLALSPETAHKGTIAACLSYRAYPHDTDVVKAGSKEANEDEAFFLAEAMKGDPTWYGKLMADHTSLDWRESIRANFGVMSGSETKALVIASSRSGCFPAEGPMKVVELIDVGERERELEAEYRKVPKGQGVVVDWGGHWSYWENPEKFNELALKFLGDER